MGQQASMTFLEYKEMFGTEEGCREYLYKMRWKDGFVCPKCGASGESFNIKSRNLYQCKQCTHQTSVTAGTIMDKTRTPLVKWFLAVYLMSKDKRGCSALHLQRELKVTYKTAWSMAHKIRKAMGNRDKQYLLCGIVEMDDSFFGSPSEGKGKRGRGTDKIAVVIGLSLGEQGTPGYVRAEVVPSVNGDRIASFTEKAVEKNSAVKTDGYRAYRKLSSKGYIHLPEKFDPAKSPEHLKHLHIVISNIKAFLNGTYHGVGRKHMQLFLDEFCYRFNRRFWQKQLFGRALVACSSCPPFIWKDIIMS